MAEATATAAPMVKWAQRKELLYITIDLTDVESPDITITPEGKFTFKGRGGPDQKEYAFDITFHGEINVDNSKRIFNERKLFFGLQKKERGPHWPRLCNDKLKRHWLKIDFEKWKDEDDETEDAYRQYDNDAPKPENYLNIPGVETLAGEKVALTTDDDSDDTDAEDLETDEGGATELRNHHVEFQKIVDKYDLKNEDRAERLAWFLTNTDNVTVTPEMVQKEFGFSISEAHTFMSWIEIGVKFKDENLGESGNDREQMAHQLKNMKAS